MIYDATRNECRLYTNATYNKLLKINTYLNKYDC